MQLQVVDGAALEAATANEERAGAGEKLLQLLRHVAVRTFRFLHLCSGHRREDDLEDWLTAFFADAGAFCVVLSYDVGHGPDYDLTDDRRAEELRLRAEAGELDGGHAGPPCGAWSRVRFRMGGPRPCA